MEVCRGVTSAVDISVFPVPKDDVMKTWSYSSTYFLTSALYGTE
jgi:hypothetical protein